MTSLKNILPRSIHTRFLFFLLGLTAIPVVFAIGTLEWMRYQESYSKLVDKLDGMTATQSLLLAEPLWTKNWEQIQLNSATLISDPDVIAISIVNAENKLIYKHGDFPEVKSQLVAKRSISYVDDINIEVIGSIELVLTDEHITSAIKQRLYERGLMLCIFLFIVISAYLVLQFTVGRALKRLLYSIKKSKDEDVLVPVEWESNDELGMVISAYNAMQVRQQQDAAKLQLSHEILEQRVIERTQKLSQEISNRKQVERDLIKQEQGLQMFLDGVPVMLWMLGADNKTMRFNESWLKFNGLTLLQEQQLDWKAEDIHPDYRKQCLQTYQESINKKISFSQEYQKQNSEGHYRWISEIGIPNFDANGQYLGYFGTCFDITTRKEAENKLFEEKERAQVTLSSIGDGVITTDANGIVQFINPTAERKMGCSQQDVIGQALVSIFKIYDEITRKPLPSSIDICLEQQCIIGNKDAILLVSADGQEYFIKDSTAPIFNQQKQIIGTVLVFMDITESRKLTQKLSYQASHDPLTGLVNRSEFEKRVQRILDIERNTDDEYALLYMDLDQFKIINDTCGHIAGDELLRQLTGVLKYELRKRDTLARLGGDEFGVLIEHCKLKQAMQVARDFSKAVEQFRFHWEEKTFTLGISIGVVAITSQDISLEQLLIDADSACYAAKSSGRGRVHVYQKNDAILAKRFGEMEWTTRINQALDEDRFCLYWQPIYSVQEKANTHCELLIRMISEDGQIIAPGFFLPAAEQYNLAVNIDQWVIKKAFSWIASLPEKDQTIQHFGINLSGHSLSDDSCIEFIINQLQVQHVPTEKVCFEITETAVIENLSSAIEGISRLKLLGCQFALDDFGSGLSSFAYLKQLPVDYLKIDGFFVKGMDKDPIDLEMVRSIHKIGQVMGKKTIAEFVENEVILEHLRDMGVDYAQGYHLDKPMPIEEFKLSNKANNSEAA